MILFTVRHAHCLPVQDASAALAPARIRALVPSAPTRDFVRGTPWVSTLRMSALKCWLDRSRTLAARVPVCSWVISRPYQAAFLVHHFDLAAAASLLAYTCFLVATAG